MNLLCATQKEHSENMREVFKIFSDSRKQNTK